MVPISKRRAASLKGWRTRKRMKDAREINPEKSGGETYGNASTGLPLPPTEPAYIRRALPNPFLEMK
jgi:hypothetical protein